jgi:tripartite ATP-independent transporter DctM subunit
MAVGFLFGAMVLLIVIGVPIAISIGTAAALTILIGAVHANLEVVPSRLLYGVDSFLILAVPLFLLLGDVMERAGITSRLVDFAYALVGRWRGAMGHVTVVSNIFMAGISGSGAADAAATGVALIPALERAGFSRAFGAALVAASSTIGPIIPPSIIMVIYASITGVSVGQLFLAGVVPGLVMAIVLMLAVFLQARRHPQEAQARAPVPRPLPALRSASLVLLAPLIVVLGIVGGVFTATESAAIACAYALLLGLLVYRTIKPRQLIEIVSTSALASAKVMLIVAAASVFSWVMTRAGVGEVVSSLPLFGAGAPGWLMLLALNVVLLVLGCFMDAIAILLIITPVIQPLALRAGIDPVHLGVVMSINLSIGLITPPFGTAMFVLLGIAKIDMLQFARAVWPLILVLIVALLLVTYIPAISLFLPQLLK